MDADQRRRQRRTGRFLESIRRVLIMVEVFCALLEDVDVTFQDAANESVTEQMMEKFTHTRQVHKHVDVITVKLRFKEERCSSPS